MSNVSVRGITRIRGRLCFDPTDLSTPFPHGGTTLGVVRTTARRYVSEEYIIRAEEFGGAPVDVVTDSESPVIAAVMATWDTALLTKLFGGGQGSSTSRGTLQRNVRDFRAGTRRSGVKLYISPKDADDPGIILYNAVSLIRLDGQSIFNAETEYGLPIAWQALPDTQGRVLFEGLRSDTPV